MIAASTLEISHPPICVSGPLRSARQSRPLPWMRTFFSEPGSEAYCGFSESLVQSAGGLFQPGVAVETCPGPGGDSAFGVATCGFALWFTSAFLVGAVVGGAGDCAAAASGSARAAPRINAP